MNATVLMFCTADTRQQIAESVAAARARGLKARGEEERERRRFAAALCLVEHGDGDQRALGVGVLKSIRGPRL